MKAIYNFAEVMHLCDMDGHYDRLKQQKQQYTYGDVVENNIVGVLKQQSTPISIQKTGDHHDFSFGADFLVRYAGTSFYMDVKSYRVDDVRGVYSTMNFHGTPFEIELTNGFKVRFLFKLQGKMFRYAKPVILLSVWNDTDTYTFPHFSPEDVGALVSLFARAAWASTKKTTFIDGVKYGPYHYHCEDVQVLDKGLIAHIEKEEELFLSIFKSERL
ncbi:MAG: hypothetical protein ACRC5C_13130 [Bacilli bacterium]